MGYFYLFKELANKQGTVFRREPFYGPKSRDAVPHTRPKVPAILSDFIGTALRKFQVHEIDQSLIRENNKYFKLAVILSAFSVPIVSIGLFDLSVLLGLSITFICGLAAITSLGAISVMVSVKNKKSKNVKIPPEQFFEILTHYALKYDLEPRRAVRYLIQKFDHQVEVKKILKAMSIEWKNFFINGYQKNINLRTYIVKNPNSFSCREEYSEVFSSKIIKLINYIDDF